MQINLIVKSANQRLKILELVTKQNHFIGIAKTGISKCAAQSLVKL